MPAYGEDGMGVFNYQYVVHSPYLYWGKRTRPLCPRTVRYPCQTAQPGAAAAPWSGRPGTWLCCRCKINNNTDNPWAPAAGGGGAAPGSLWTGQQGAGGPHNNQVSQERSDTVSRFGNVGSRELGVFGGVWCVLGQFGVFGGVWCFLGSLVCTESFDGTRYLHWCYSFFKHCSQTLKAR